MNYMQIFTAIAALLAGLWTLTQLVAYVREKDPKNLKIAVVLLIVITAMILAYPHLKERVVPLALETVKGSHGAGQTGRPVQASPAPSRTDNQGYVIAPTATGEVVTPSVQQSSVPSQDITGGGAVSTPPVSPPPTSAPVASGAAKGELKSSFVIDIRRNVLGGINDIVARCTFAEVGNSDVEIFSYTITVHYLDSPEDPADKALTRSFERTLKDRIAVKADTTVQKDIALDRETGDVVLKSRKSKSVGWITISWTGRDGAGNEISSQSTSNRPDEGAQ
jgi:hypothetical protein